MQHKNSALAARRGSRLNLRYRASRRHRRDLTLWLAAGPAVFADRARLKLEIGRGQLARAAVFVDGDKGELGVGDLDPGALALAQHPDLDIERDRGSPELLDVGVAADGVADILPAESIKDMIQPPK